MRADTGVGPAMASGSQVWSGNWADFPMTPMNSADAPTTSAVRPMSPLMAAKLMSFMSNVMPAAKNRVTMPTSRPMSPVRVVRNALRAALEFSCFSHQWPINMKLHRPISSHPNSSCKVEELTTSRNMPVVKRLRAAK